MNAAVHAFRTHYSPVSENLPAHHRRLRLLSYNIQAGVASTRFHHYVTRSWKHFLPHLTSFENLDRIAKVLAEYDIVGLQEVDGGSLRSHFINQVEYLAQRGQFPHWYHQTNRNLGKFAQHSNGLLSKLAPAEITEHKLPGIIPGRGVMLARYGSDKHPLVFLMVHLALGRRARLQQLRFISELVINYKHVVLMGDFNCQPHSEEMRLLLDNTHLGEPTNTAHTYPSWGPQRNIDHILVSPSIQVHKTQVLKHALSDHLPVALEVDVPDVVFA